MDHNRHSVTLVELNARAERCLIRPTGSKRYVAFFVKVNHIPTVEKPPRLPLRLALVLDRSGSMHGDKLHTAKQATQAVLDRLTERDSISLVVFDNTIDTLQSLAPVTPHLKRQIRRALDRVEARASTALHEGWLTGCNAIAGQTTAPATQSLSRCFLLTDGLANVGVTDPERIASEAAGVREHTGIATSTFGIGSDYNELLLGPMAVAGGGQFHHLRDPQEIINTFVGELGNLLSVAARRVTLEIEADHHVHLDLISPYWIKSTSGDTTRWSIAIGDLQNDEERPVVVRCTFPVQDDRREQQAIRARLTWLTDDTYATSWQELPFSYASQSACDDEPQDRAVIDLVGQHEADFARRQAIAQNNRGDLAGACQSLQDAVAHLASLAPASPQVRQEIAELDALRQQMAHASTPSLYTKELYYGQQLRSRGQKDYRYRTAESPGQTEKERKESKDKK